MKEVIILGTSFSARDCPFNCETWSINAGYQLRDYLTPFRLDRLFITDRLYSVEDETINFDVPRMNALGIPIVSMHKIEGLNCELYPFKEIVKEFNTRYFTNTIDYAIAYAIYKGYKKIKLYGVDMVAPREVEFQRCGIGYWLGRAEERGCKVSVSDGSELFKTNGDVPYGFLPDEIPEEVLANERT